MGTPLFAVASLDALLQEGFPVVGVVTAPDRPAGRGMRPRESEVKQFAAQHKLSLLQPEKLKDPVFVEKLRSWNADLQVVVAFRMLPKIVWSMPPMGTINLHASLLPQYRGAAPINWAIINGERKTGLTTFRLKHEVDTGDILMQEQLIIGENESAGELHDRMKESGAGLLVRTIRALTRGELVPLSQESFLRDQTDVLKTAPKITPETCRIRWEEAAEKIHNLVRGLSPTPGAFTEFDGRIMKIFRSRYERLQHSRPPGSYETDQRSFLRFNCADGQLYVLDLQLEGRKKMQVEDFLRGYRFGSQ